MSEEPEADRSEDDEDLRSHRKLISQRGYYHLDPLERAMIVHAKRKHPDLPNALLAKMFGITANAVDRMVNRYALLPATTKELLQAMAPDAVRDLKRASTVAAERGDPMPAEKILIHAGELEPIAERNERAFGPQIIVGILPGMPTAAPEGPQQALPAVNGVVVSPEPAREPLAAPEPQKEP